MKYTVENKKGQAQINIELDSNDFENALERAYQANKGRYAHAGFRKGHVPRKVLESVYGKTLFHEDALNDAVARYYYEILDKETELHPVAQPEISVDEMSEKGVKLTATVTLKPAVTLGQYKGLNIERKAIKVTDEEIEAELKKAAEKNARMVKIEDRGIINGDEAAFDFSGSVGGEKFDGGTAENYKLVIGSGRFIPGFEEQMIGMKAGEEKDVKVKFPDDYHAANLKGKDAVFAVKVREIYIKEFPAVDDELAKDASEFESLKDWKDDVRKNLEKAAEKRAETAFENDIIEKVVAGAGLEIPDVMIEQQVERYIEEFEASLSYQGLKLADYEKHTGVSAEQMRNDYRPRAEETVRTRLVLEEIIKQEKLFPSAKDMDAKIAELAGASGKTAAEFKKMLKQDDLNYIMNEIVSKNLTEFLKKSNNMVNGEKI